MNCICCDSLIGMPEPAGGIIHVDQHWSIYLRARPTLVVEQGFLVLRRHCESLAELTDEESESLGPILRHATQVFQQVLRAERIHWGLYGEETRHVHWHITPRTQNLPSGNIPLVALHLIRSLRQRAGLYKPVSAATVISLAVALGRRFSESPTAFESR